MMGVRVQRDRENLQVRSKRSSSRGGEEEAKEDEKKQEDRATKEQIK